MSHATAILTCLAVLAAYGCTQEAGVNGPATPPGSFEDVSAAVGLPASPDVPIENRYFMPTSIGSGAALFDYDDDGDLDVFLVHGAVGGGRFVDGEPWSPRLLRQEADGRLVDVTARAGAFPPGLGMGVAIGDADGDGDGDLYVSNYGPDALYRNEGDGTFTDVSRAAGIANPAWGASALFFDYDLDGDQDLFVTNYVDVDLDEVCTDNGGRPDYCGPAGFPGVADVLYRNDGNGTFTDVSSSSGIAAAPAPGLGAVSADFDGDRGPDLYVANDGAPNQLWIRRGDGVFEDRAVAVGAALNALARSEAGMGIALGDADGDADWDFFVTHLKGETNTFYRRQGEQFFDETLSAGLAGVSVPYTGFGTAFLDFDLDGDLDLAVANGRVTRGARWDEGKGYWDDYAEPNLLFDDDGEGHFRDVSRQAGAWFDRRESSRGLALGDFDRDGRIDLLVTSSGGGARLFRGRGPSPGSWLSVRVLDGPERGDSLGAQVTAVVGERRLERLVGPVAGFLSGSEARAHFGLGGAAAVDQLVVRWPDGASARFSSLPACRRIRVTRRRR